MTVLDQPYELWMIIHIMTPFFIVYLFNGLKGPIISLAIVFLNELFEWILLYSADDGTYGALFPSAKAENILNVWLYDIGGGIMGIILAVSFQYIKNVTNVTNIDGNFLKPFLPTSTEKFIYRLLRFAFLIGPSGLFGRVGWDCGWITAWCVDGYNAFPWGAPPMIITYIIFSWWIDLSKLTYVLIVILFIPSFIPVTKESQPIPESFIQLISVFSIGILVFTGSLINRCRVKSQTSQSSNNNLSLVQTSDSFGMQIRNWSQMRIP